MIVRCENCGTEFGFDDRQIGDGVTVRCSVCKHVFKVESPSAPAPGWQIRTTDDMSFAAPDVGTLREWIDEGRLHPDDRVSRTGRNWVRLGDMPEFSRAFARFEAVASVASPVREVDPRVVPGAGGRAPSGPSVAAARVVAAGQSLGAGGLLAAPQSQRLTLSPPRSAPPLAPAPVAEMLPVARPKAPGRPVLPPSTRAPKPAAIFFGDDDDTFEVDEEVEEVDEDEEVDEEVDEVEAAPVATPVRSSERAAPKPEPDDEDDDEDEDDADDEDDEELDAFEADTVERRGIGPGLIALLGVITAVGVAFGVPQIRTRLLNLGQGAAQADVPARGPETIAAEAAVRSLGAAALDQAEADLRRALEAGAGNPDALAPMQLALADLLFNRAIAYEIAAALDAGQRVDLRRRAAKDQADGQGLLDELGSETNAEELRELRALARLANGRPEVELTPLIADSGAEIRLVVRAAILWQDLAAPVPPGLVAGLRELDDETRRNGLSQAALALALVRAGDVVAARNLTEHMLANAEDHLVARAVLARVGDEASVEDVEDVADIDGTEGAEGAGEREAAEASIAKAPPRPEERESGPVASSSPSPSPSPSPSTAGMSHDRLVKRGCEQVASGDASGGVKTLLKAFDMKPQDLDMLVCLADGYAAQRANASASTFYDRALAQSPSHIPALRGAASIAAKTGATQRAEGLYERLLVADPGNATAKAYLAKLAAEAPVAASPGAQPALPLPPEDTQSP